MAPATPTGALPATNPAAQNPKGQGPNDLPAPHGMDTLPDSPQEPRKVPSPINPSPVHRPQSFESNPAFSRPADDEFAFDEGPSLPDRRSPAYPEPSPVFAPASSTPQSPTAPAPAAPAITHDFNLPDQPVAAAAANTAAAASDLDSFLARPITPPTAAAPSAPRPPLSLIEKASLAIAIAILLGFAFWFSATIIKSNPKDGLVNSTHWPNLPISGSIARITSASAAWRPTHPTDNVGRVESSLPFPGLRAPAIIPVVSFAIDPAPNASGFLRFLFVDSTGRSSGDVRVARIENGQLKPTERAAFSITNSSSAEVHGSLGFLDLPSFLSYTASTERRWHVEVSECSRADAPDRDWSRLAVFDLRNDLKD